MVDILSLFAGAVLLASQAAAPPAPDSVLGEVAVVAAGSLTVRTDGGGRVVLRTDGRTAVLRSRPGAKSLADAALVPLAEVAVGDRVLARGSWSEDRTALSTTRLVVMKRPDLELKRELEQAEWRRRGVGGVVTALDPATREMAVRLRAGGDGQREVVVPTAGRAVLFRRYAPNSVKFSDARPSTFEELGVGDQVRLLGERSADGGTFVAEQAVSGVFRTIRGAVLQVDAPRGELRVEAESNGDPPTTVTVTVGPDARLLRLPAELSRSSPGEGSRPRRGSLDEMLDALPGMPLAQVAPGEQVAVVGTRAQDASRLTAIKLVAGLPAREARAAEGRGERSGPEGDGEGADRLGFGGESPW